MGLMDRMQQKSAEEGNTTQPSLAVQQAQQEQQEAQQLSKADPLT